MNITRQRIQNLIKEAIANDSTASSTGLITIEQYLESVDYDVDPSLVDLFFTLIPLGFMVKFSSSDKTEFSLVRPAIKHHATGAMIFDQLDVWDYGEVDLYIRYPRTIYFNYESHGQAAMEIPRVIESHYKKYEKRS